MDGGEEGERKDERRCQEKNEVCASWEDGEVGGRS